MPPTSTLGSTPPAVRTHPVSDVVVVFPCVPAITIDRAPHKKCSRIDLGQRAVPDLAVEDLFELGVSARNRVADDDQVEIRGDVRGMVPAQGWNALRGQKIAHRRVDVLIGPAHLAPFVPQHGGGRRHGGAADADEMDSVHVTNRLSTIG